MTGPEKKKKDINNKSKIQIIASRIAGLFGIGFYNLYYVEKNLLTDIATVEPLIEIEIRKAADGEMREILNRLTDKDRKNFEYNIEIKGICYVAAHKDRIAAYSWASLKYIYLDGMKLAELPAKGSYHGDTYVFPEFRGKKILQKLIDTVYSDMKQAGCFFTGTIIAKNNIPAVAANKSFHLKYQTAHILRIPGPKPLIISKRFIIGASCDSGGISK